MARKTPPSPLPRHYDFSQGHHHQPSVVYVFPSTFSMERPVTTVGWMNLNGREEGDIQMWGERQYRYRH